MKDEFHIDLNKHVIPFKKTGDILKKKLLNKFGREEGEKIWKNTISIYEGWCKDLPYIGGKENFQAHSFYDSVFLFAYWEALPVKESTEEFTDTVCNVFAGCDFDKELLRSGNYSDEVKENLILNANHTKLLKCVLPVYKRIFKKINTKKKNGEWNNAWALDFPEEQPEEGIRMRLVGCPVMDFAREHHYEELMPAMCNPDYMMLRKLNVSLIRPEIVAKGSKYCDQSMVGDKSELSKKYEIVKDEKGFLYSRAKEKDNG